MCLQSHNIGCADKTCFCRPAVICIDHMMPLLQIILTHSISKVVFQLLKAAADAKKRIMVFIAESGRDKSG